MPPILFLSFLLSLGKLSLCPCLSRRSSDISCTTSTPWVSSYWLSYSNELFAICLWYTPLSSCPLLLNSYYLSISRHFLEKWSTSYLTSMLSCIMGSLSKDTDFSLMVELKGARIMDLDEWLRRVLYCDSMLCWVKQSIGSSFSFRLYLLWSL